MISTVKTVEKHVKEAGETQFYYTCICTNNRYLCNYSYYVLLSKLDNNNIF